MLLGPGLALDGDAAPMISGVAQGSAAGDLAPALDALGWDRAVREREVEHYVKRVEAERESQRMPDDETADAARMGAPEIVPVR